MYNGVAKKEVHSMELEYTINYLDEKIEEINAYAEMRANDMPDDIVDKVIKLKDRSVTVLEDVKAKVVNTASKVEHDEEFASFLDQVVEKSEAAVEYTKTKIDETVAMVRHDEKLKEASKQIQDTFDEIKNNDEVKEMVSSIKEVTASIYSQIEDYMSKPETQETIAKAKISTVKIAEKGVVALKKLLKVED